MFSMNDQELYNFFGHGFCFLSVLIFIMAILVYIAYDHINTRALMISSGYVLWCGFGMYGLSKTLELLN